MALEIRPANRIAIVTTEISIRGEHKALNETTLANDYVAQLLVKELDPDADFSPVETEKLYAYLYACMNTWLSIETAYVNGMVTDATFEVTLDGVRGYYVTILAYSP